MPEVREQAEQKLAAIAAEVARAQKMFRAVGNGSSAGVTGRDELKSAESMADAVSRANGYQGSSYSSHLLAAASDATSSKWPLRPSFGQVEPAAQVAPAATA